MNVEYINFAVGSSLLRVSVGYLAALDARPSSDGRFRRLLLAPGDPATSTRRPEVVVRSPPKASPTAAAAAEAAAAAAAASFELQTDPSGSADYVLRVTGLDVCDRPDAISPILRVFELPPKAGAAPAHAAPVNPQTPAASHTDTATIPRTDKEALTSSGGALATTGGGADTPQVTYHVFLVGVTLTVVEAAGAAGPAAARRATAATSLMLKHSQRPDGASVGRLHMQEAVLSVSGSGADGGRAVRQLFGQPVSLSLDYELLLGGATKAALQGGEIEVNVAAVFFL